jgi:MtN3 and saliva related transmembrane protein
MDPIDILGLLCAMLTGILYIPQLVHMIKRKSTKDVSYLFLILTILNSIMWVVYGFYKINIPIILSDIFIFLTSVIMLIVKIFYENVTLEEN